MSGDLFPVEKDTLFWNLTLLKNLRFLKKIDFDISFHVRKSLKNIIRQNMSDFKRVYLFLQEKYPQTCVYLEKINVIEIRFFWRGGDFREIFTSNITSSYHRKNCWNFSSQANFPDFDLLKISLKSPPPPKISECIRSGLIYISIKKLFLDLFHKNFLLISNCLMGFWPKNA